MPDPGEPGPYAARGPMSTLPTPAKPWYGEPLPVPSYLNGLPVISAVRVPTGRGEVSHVWMVIVYDETGRRGPRGGLINLRGAFPGRLEVVWRRALDQLPRRPQ